MKDINRPISVKSWRLNEKAKGMSSLAPGQLKLEDDKVLTFLHAGKGMMEFIQICSEDPNDSLEITQNHLVFCKDNQGLRFKYPRQLVVGEHLVKQDGTLMEITKINTIISEGFYAPLTANGTLVVNGFLTSCYAWHPNHDNMHLFMKPLILYKTLNPSKTFECSDESIHNYC